MVGVVVSIVGEYIVMVIVTAGASTALNMIENSQGQRRLGDWGLCRVVREASRAIPFLGHVVIAYFRTSIVEIRVVRTDAS